MHEADAAIKRAEMTERERLAAIAKQQAIEERRQTAFDAFMRLVPCVELPTAAGGVDLGRRELPTRPVTIDLGPFAADDLLEPQFRLAVPRDTIDGQPFVATITDQGKVQGADRTWIIRHQPQAESRDGQAPKPKVLATLVARNNRLFMEVPKSNELAMRPFALLRRSVILAEARDPAGGDAPPIVKEIRLVKPVEVGPFSIDPLGERQAFTIASSPEIASNDTPAGHDKPILYQLPVTSIAIKADLMGTPIDVQLPRDLKPGTDPGIGEWQVNLARLHPDPQMLSLAMDVKMSIREGELTVTPTFVGRNAHLVTLEMVRRNFIDNPEEALKKVLGAFDRRVKDCAGHDFGKSRTVKGAGIIQSWLAGRLATEEKGGMGMTLPGHETIAASFDLYVKERHAADPNKPKDGAAWLETLKPIKDAGEWKKHFSEPLGRWAAWFRPQFEKQ
ncbi:MAG: hypothetical protein ACKO1M_06290, partial [Planctomycetota bacterium]